MVDSGYYNVALVDAADSDGDFLWNLTFGVGDSSGGANEAVSIIRTSDGGYAVTGSINSALWLAKLAPDITPTPTMTATPTLLQTATSSPSQNLSPSPTLALTMSPTVQPSFNNSVMPWPYDAFLIYIAAVGVAVVIYVSFVYVRRKR